MKRMIAAAAALSCAGAVLASGDYNPAYTMFKAYTKPDIPLARFQAGKLGVLQPGMRRVYLYTAWRAIMLGPEIARRPGTAQGLARADGSAFGNGWSDGGGDGSADSAAGRGNDDFALRTAAVLGLKADDWAARNKIDACPAPARAFVRATFAALAARPDATKARVDGWVRAQYQVSEACQQAEDARYAWREDKQPEIVPPQPLPAAEPAYWRMLRDYQRAAWQFQGGHYAESTALFERIGATKGHPMQPLGAYLALRSEVRRVVAAAKDQPPGQRERQARALEQRGEAIVGDAGLAAMHEPTRALLRAMRAALTPESRLEELARYLDDPRNDPYALDRLGDWSVLMDGKHADQRAAHAYADWIETVQACGAQQACDAQAAHALERWQHAPRAQRGPWLVAALMLSTAMTPELEKAALAVGADDPAWVTVRYHLARLYRLQDKRDQARTVADGVLQRTLTPATRNLLREERFAAATSVRDAAGYLLRTNVDYYVPEGESPKENMLNDDGLAWINRNLALADLVELARVEALPAPLRARIAGAAWIRAGLLDRQEEGRQAAALLAGLVPAAASATQRYAQAPSPAERRHAVLVAGAAFGLAADASMDSPKVERVAADEATASMWCSFKPEQPLGEPRFVWRLPPPPAAGDAGAARAELARLAPVKTATGTLGDDVLAWADSHPKDPELPWLLHVVVQSTRGGCLDDDAKTLSRKAFNLLHKRYPKSEWAKKTPYFY